MPATSLIQLILSYGGIGLLVIGILDSSYLFLPWGNDLLVIALTARHPQTATMLYYAAMSTLGSLGGCLILDLTMRPLGAQGLEKHLSKRALGRVRGKVEKNAGRAVTLASLAPPPFPFTAVMMAASAAQYSRYRLFTVIGVTRMLRFTVLGFLAIRYGERLLRWAKIPAVRDSFIGLMVICVVGSIWSVYGWVKRSRSGQ